MALYLNVGNDGRIVIPKNIRQSLGIKKNSKVIAKLDENGIYITTIEKSLAKARAQVAKYCKSGESIVDSFIAQKRIDAKNEESNFNALSQNNE